MTETGERCLQIGYVIAGGCLRRNSFAQESSPKSIEVLRRGKRTANGQWPFILWFRVHLETVPRNTKKALVELPANNTVKLSEPLRVRVLKAMQAEGFTVWSEFCRVALTEKCRIVESELRVRDPEEWERIFGSRLPRESMPEEI